MNILVLSLVSTPAAMLSHVLGKPERRHQRSLHYKLFGKYVSQSPSLHSQSLFPQVKNHLKVMAFPSPFSAATLQIAHENRVNQPRGLFPAGLCSIAGVCVFVCLRFYKAKATERKKSHFFVLCFSFFFSLCCYLLFSSLSHRRCSQPQASLLCEKWFIYIRPATWIHSESSCFLPQPKLPFNPQWTFNGWNSSPTMKLKNYNVD